MSFSRWEYKKEVPEEVRKAFSDLPLAVAQILHNRGVFPGKNAETFLDPDYEQHSHDPFLFRDMEKAVTRIQEALRKQELIIAHGDYDADGVCGAAVLVDGLKRVGARVEPYIPHREKEGYGVNKDTVRALVKQGARLMITADCGISNAPEIELAASLGMDVIVTDHHQEPLAFPKAAYAIINPSVSAETYPFRGLAGVGVAFKLMQALYSTATAKDLPVGSEKWLLDLVAISTITDMMPLLDENRTLVKYGLVVLHKTRRFGLHALARAINVPLDQFSAHHIGFHIGPRLNAAGRLKHARLAFELIMAENEEHAQTGMEKLEQVNKDRRMISDLIASEVEAQIGEVTDEQKVLFAFGKDWPVGVVGLVANKMMQKYQRPVFILGETEGNIVASGRSVPSLNIVEVLKASEKFYLKYGGHAAACGFTLKHREDLDEWKVLVSELVGERLTGTSLSSFLEIDVRVSLKDIDWNLWSYLSKLEPFGQKNPKPVYASEGVRVRQVRAVGGGDKHLRLTLEQDGVTQQGIGFGFGEWAQKISSGSRIDVAFGIEINHWNGNKQLQLNIIDLRV